MSKNFFKYLSILSLLILSGITGLYANSLAHNNHICSVHQIEINSNVSFRPLEQNDDKNLVFEVAETQEIENEESISESNPCSYQSFLAYFLKLSVFDGISNQSLKGLYCFKNYHDKSSTKLHVRLQVFII